MPPSLSPPVPEQWTGPFAPGGEAKPSGHCVQHQPCTLAKRGTDNSKAQGGFRQSGQGSQAHTNVQSSLLLSSSLCHTPLVCRTDPLRCLLLFFTPTGGEHPSSSHCLAKLRPSCIHPPSPLGAPDTSSDCAFPSCSLCCHLQPHDSPRGQERDWHGLPIPEEST